MTCQSQAQGSVLASEAFAPLLPLDGMLLPTLAFKHL